MQTQAKDTSLSKEQILKLLEEYFIFKAKGFSQNSVFDKRKAAVFLSMKHHFKSFKMAHLFISQARKLGIISVGSLYYTLKCVEHFVERDGYFNPNMTDRAYIDYFFSLTKTLKSSTILFEYRSVSLFLLFLATKGIAVNNIKNLQLRFLKDKKLPSFLNQAQYESFLQEAHNLKENTLRQKRDKLSLLIVAYTGIRRRELDNIKLSDICKDADGYMIKIQGKCAQERYVSIKRKFLGSLLEDFTHHKEQMGIKTAHLLNINPRNPKQPSRFAINVKAILKKLDCVQERGNHLHLLRHSFASFVYRQTKDIVLTQQALGHSSINNTQIYIHMNHDTYERVANLF